MNKFILIIIKICAYGIDLLVLFLLLLLFGRGNVILYYCCFIFFFIYRYLMTAIWGFTLGMRVLGLRLQNYGYRSCLTREVLRIGSGFYYIGYIYGLFNGTGRTIHDILSGTTVNYEGTINEKYGAPKAMYIIVGLLITCSILKWSTSILLNDIGMFGLHKEYTSQRFHQSFKGDNLISLTQQQLYMHTLGRSYTTVTSYRRKTYLTLISNKSTYTQVFRLLPRGNKLICRYAYSIPIALQYVSSISIMGSKYLCGISSTGIIVVVDEGGRILSRGYISPGGILSLRCGELDGYGSEALSVLYASGEVRLLKLVGKELIYTYIGKPIKALNPQGMFISSNKLSIVGSGYKESKLYSFSYRDRNISLVNKSTIPTNEISYAERTAYGVAISNINRMNMMLGVGTMQRIAIYAASGSGKLKLENNLSVKQGKLHNYRIRNIEGIYDIDDKGGEEIIVKVVKKGDIMGSDYELEAYELRPWGLYLNGIVTKLNRILKLNFI